MKYRMENHSMTEEEVKADKKYLEIREFIKPEELTIMFENKAQIRLRKYSKVFEQIEKIEGEGFFSHLNTTLNVAQLKELTIKFFELINPEWKKEVENIFNGTNSNVQLNICEEDEKFRADHSKVRIAGGGIVIPEEMLEEYKKNSPELYNEIIELNKEKIMTFINLSLTSSLNDMYNLVHEITHYFTFRDTATERIFSEVAPQCMERILDDFLGQLSDDELNNYNFKKEEISNDIRKRRIISFVSRYKATKDFNKNNNLKNNEEEFLKYFLAQFFQAQFRKYNVKDKKKRIIEFIQYVKNDKFEMATKTFGVDWTNTLKRSFYVDDIIEDIKIDLEEKNKDNKENKKKEKEREQR